MSGTVFYLPALVNSIQGYNVLTANVKTQMNHGQLLIDRGEWHAALDVFRLAGAIIRSLSRYAGYSSAVATIQMSMATCYEGLNMREEAIQEIRILDHFKSLSRTSSEYV